MYTKWNGSNMEHMNGIPKTVRMDKETIAAVEAYQGRDFSKKLRNLINDHVRQNQENVRHTEGNDSE